ncbi:PREDICTED: tripartite motif-containing protein 45-like [Polistes canadensis]|uniref:tripartite motif-containing protein 45-like n=1 Tax=Polistes canadensis TaxID=91411 RepID=UPI000718C34B|nr:PREDICTED: tripartite motif-containing protein 45-like [Polistes canadensis]
MEFMELVNCSVKNQLEKNCFGNGKTIEEEIESNTLNNNNENVTYFTDKKKYRNNQSIITIEPKRISADARNGLRWSMEQKIGSLSYKFSDNGNLNSECNKENKMQIIPNIHENKDFLCSRCGKKMREPRLLPCLHAMCSPCVFDLIEKANNVDSSKLQKNNNINPVCNIYERCPLCNFCLSNTYFIIPPPHYPLQHRLVVDAMRRKLADRILCDTCPDEVVAIVQCCACLRNFCSDCGNEHEEQTRMELKQGKHIVKPLWEATRIRRTILCQIHPSNALRYYCNACQQICCKECIWSIEHRGHASENAIGAGRRAAAYLTTMLERAKTLLNSLLICYSEDVFSNDIFNEQEHFIDQWYVK